MRNEKKRTFSSEFRLEAAQLVVNEGYTVREAAIATNVSLATMGRWVAQLRQEYNGQTPEATAMTPVHQEIQRLKKEVSRLEKHNALLKKSFSRGMLTAQKK